MATPACQSIKKDDISDVVFNSYIIYIFLSFYLYLLNLFVQSLKISNTILNIFITRQGQGSSWACLVILAL